MRATLAVGVLALALGIGACGDGNSDGGADLSRDSAGATSNGDASGGASAGETAAPAEKKSYDSRGKVVKVDAERSRIELDHEQIGDWMDPMTMPFPVSDPTLLSGLEEGQTVAFTVEVTGEDYTITKIARQ